jgi:excisionase family DNA binding protein
MAATPSNDAPSLLLTVEQAAQRIGVGRSNMFKLISSGAIDSIKIGRLRKVKPSALEDYIARLTAEQGKAA